jgi:hypothetical protein
MEISRIIWATSCVALLSGCDGGRASDAETWTLYRNSMLDKTMRIHWATFDAKDGPGFNRENCMAAAGVINRQREVTVLYWCENGRFRPK